MQHALFLLVGCLTFALPAADPALAKQLAAFQSQGGAAVAVGAVDGDELAALAKGGRWLVQSLHADAAEADRRRVAAAKAGVFPNLGAAWQSDAATLPHPDHTVNLLIVDGAAGVPAAELARVTAFGGTRLIKQGGAWKAEVEPVPAEVDEWTHTLYGPGRSPISKDKRIRPTTGIAWMASPRLASGTSFRIHAGMLVSVENRVLPSGKVELNTYDLVARDAHSGLLRWVQPLTIGSIPNYASSYIRTTHQFVASAGLVFYFPADDAPLTAYDIHTGAVVRTYPAAGALKPDTSPKKVHWERKTPLGYPSACVLQRDQRLFVALHNRGTMMDLDTGKELWSVQAENPEASLTSAVWTDQGIHYLEKVANRAVALVSVHADDGKRRWRVPLGRNPAGEILGPDANFIPIAYASETLKRDEPWPAGVDEPEKNNPGERSMLVGMHRVSDGSRLYLKRTGGGGRNQGWMRAGKLNWQGASDSVEVFEPETYKPIERYRWDPAGIGCPVCVETETLHIRGIQVSPHADLRRVLGTQGTRTNCETPTIPAYGRLYSPGSGCGCTWFLPAGIMGGWMPPVAAPLPDAARLRRDGAPALAGAVAGAAIAGPINEDAARACDVIERKPGKLGHVQKDAGQQSHGDAKWYTAVETKPVTAGDLSLVSVVAGQRVEARRGGQVVWTALLDGRCVTPPLIEGALALVPCTDGSVSALNLADGSLAWRRIVAPAQRTLVTYGRFESAWPVLGLIKVEGTVVACAGRSSTMDDGMRASGLDPATGAERWRVQINFLPADERMKPGEGKNQGRGYAQTHKMLINAPPKFFDGKIRFLGAIGIDPKDPKDWIHNEAVRLDPAQLPQ
jgi:outer membrane protein assembly factor BamB